jgi:hypothetical protein
MGFKKWISGGYQAEAKASILKTKLGGLAIEGDEVIVGDERRSVVGLTASVVDHGPGQSKVSGGRVIGGAVLFGPVGAIVGGMAKKHSRGDGAILLDGPDFQAFVPFKAGMLTEARALVAAINTAARSAAN